VSGPEDLRVGDAERTRVTESLHDHFAQGRLTRDELEERLDATLTARTVGDLRRVTRDLPIPEAAGGPDRTITPARHRRPRPPFFALGLIAFLAIASLISGPGWALLGVLKVIFLIWLVMAVLGIMRVRSRHRRHWHHWQQWHRHGWYGPPRGHPWRW
jgi:hypothetical protein